LSALGAATSREMISMRRTRWMIGIVVLLGAGLALPSLALGQDDGTGGTLRTPRNNVKGGSLAANRPGTWTKAAKATHIARQQAALKDFGGANYQGPEQYPPSRRDVFLLSFFESMFQILNNLVEQLKLALQVAQTTQPAP
jgi:hypothetical protein